AALWAGLGVGLMFTLSQTVRGAHFISHGLWTGLFVWTFNVVLSRLMLRAPAPGHTTQARREAESAA
ncbi:MAG: hypothetical protein KDI19_09370, partial [Pseudomonadales bacterium]|nr:hypothetical protein [Pseudomonadales bacterium]